MKLKYEFEILNVDDEIIMVPIGKNAQQVHGVVKLNEAGRIILELLLQEKNEDDIIRKLTCQYDNEEDNLRQYVQKVVNVLKEHRLIEEKA